MKRVEAPRWLIVSAAMTACADPIHLGALTPPADAGSVEALEWSLVHVVKPPRAETGADFGHAVAWTERALLVSAATSDLCDLSDDAGGDQTCIDQGAICRLPRPIDDEASFELIKAAEAHYRDGFGRSLAATQDWLLVGVPDRSLPEQVDAGAVVPFRWTEQGWQAESVWTPPPEMQTPALGESVALHEDWAVAYAPTADCPAGTCEGRGAALVYHLDGGQWRRHQTLWLGSPIPSPEVASMWIHGEVAIHAGWIAIGSPHDECEGGGCPSSGSVRTYALKGETWQAGPTLRPEAARAYSVFGASVVLRDGHLFVGAPGEGAVYGLEADGADWTRTAYITVPEAQAAFFGAALAVHGDLLLVGAPRETNCLTGPSPTDWTSDCVDEAKLFGVPTQRGPGAAFLFTREVDGDWLLDVYLKPRSTRPSTAFGTSVAVDARTIAVGAPGETITGHGIDGYGVEGQRATGAVFLYRREPK